jgi:hypothetical protein
MFPSSFQFSHRYCKELYWRWFIHYLLERSLVRCHCCEKISRAFSYVFSEYISIQEFLGSDNLAAIFHFPISPEAMNDLWELWRVSADISTFLSLMILGHLPGEHRYTSNRYYKFCFRNLDPHVPFSWLWKSKCTPKLKFFFWLVLSDRLNTGKIIKRRHYTNQFWI